MPEFVIIPLANGVPLAGRTWIFWNVKLPAVLELVWLMVNVIAVVVTEVALNVLPLPT